MPIRFSLAKRKAQELLQEVGIRVPPVPVERLAQHLKARVRYEPFEGEMSGMRLMRGRRNIIGVNSSHSHVRQRFTIAHEIGHLILHPTDELHIDKAFPIRFRNAKSSTGEDPVEVEANQFAAELLMPEQMLMRDVRPHMKSQVEEAIQELAALYDVSTHAMTIRLSALGLIRI